MKYINKQKLLFLGLLLTLFFTLSISYAKSISSDISNSVFRLHIIANSDSDIDQALKLAVRNRILNESGFLFENANTAQSASKIAQDNLMTLCKLAQDEVIRQGFDYQVNAEVGEFAFPTKTYGDISLPSGKYSALRIKIGEAKGQNWWCVMYPPLCLTDGVISCPNQSKALLEKELSADEYNLITKQNSGAIPVEVRFKLVEIFQNFF